MTWESWNRPLELEQGPLKQIVVVRLEVNLPLAGEDLTVAQQKIRVGQAAFGVSVTGPGITEIDVDAVYLAGAKSSVRSAASPSMKKTLCRSMAHTRSMAITIASGTRSTAM